MRGTKRNAIVLGMLNALLEQGSWCGETHVQKSCHFLQEGLGVPLEVDFVMYKHGPFSFELRELLGELRGSQLLEVQPQPPYGPRLSPSESGRALMERFPKTIGQYSEQIEFVAKTLGKCDVQDLERIGTALYVTKENPGARAEERAAEVQDLKPRMDEVSALEAVAEVDRLLKGAPRTKSG